MTTCSVAACDQPVRRSGPCPEHRFWSKVNKRGPAPPRRPDLGPCWLWTAVLNHGYGQMHLDGHTRQAHRIAYRLLVGEVPPGKELDHLCRVRSCVNPAHLEPVTSRTNLLRGDGVSARNAAKERCDNGHQFTPANTYRWRGQRYCKTCRTDTSMRRARPTAPASLTVALTCKWCGSEFTFTRGRGGGTPTACSPNCRLELNRQAARECARRTRRGETLAERTASCDVCGEQFSYRPKTGRQPTACSDRCRAERQRQYMREYAQRG